MFLIGPLLYLQEKPNKQMYKNVVHKNVEIKTLRFLSFTCFRQTVTPVSHIYSVCSAYVVHIFFCTHVNGLELGYSISFIWGPDYQTENVKGSKGRPDLLLGGTDKIWN